MPTLQPPAWISRIYFALFLLLPWSYEYAFGSWRLNVPDEPLVAVLGIWLFWFGWKNPGALRALFFNHHLFAVSAAWIGWLAICVLFSTMPMVSLKYWIVEAGHWWVFAAGFALFPGLWPKAVRLFAISMAGMVVYTLIHHSFYHFRIDQVMLAPMPFFQGNTLYGAVLGMVIFVVFDPTPNPSPTGRGDAERSVDYTEGVAVYSTAPLPVGEGLGAGWSKVRPLLSILFLSGLFFSFCRAAWISVLIAGAVGILLVFRHKWRLAAIAGIILIVSGILLKEEVSVRLRNDVSGLERLNRYACAMRMAHDRPWTGFGPGTFQFQYIPYQKLEEMTRISAKMPMTEASIDAYGRGGGAHSEFFQALAEAGRPGLALWLVLTIAVLWTGFNLFSLEKDEARRWFTLALTLGLLTFFLHGLVNNMLHDGRVAALVWGSIAVLSIQVVSRK